MIILNQNHRFSHFISFLSPFFMTPHVPTACADGQ
jgi:hypothetical protein